jgi:hypothetical protein
MSTTAQYASTPFVGAGTTTTADASYSAPTTATVGVIAQALGTGIRIDQLDNISLGTSVAGLHRLFICEGDVGPTISSITSATTTATLTTATAHNLITGDIITLRNSFPIAYDVTNAAVTVTGPTTFTFTIISVAGVSARDVGSYASTPAAPIYRLVREFAVIAITASTTVSAFAYSLSSQQNAEFMPIILPPGFSLRTTVSVTQTGALNTIARGGSF